MTNPDFERDSNLLFDSSLAIGNDPDSGEILVNAVEADEFDPRYANDIEGLLYLGKLTHSPTIFGHTFVLKTLTRGERLACTLIVKEFEATLGQADALQTALIAASLVTLDGKPLTIPLSEDENNPLTRIRNNFAYIQRWFDPILESLYAEYGNLLIRQMQAFAALQDF